MERIYQEFVLEFLSDRCCYRILCAFWNIVKGNSPTSIIICYKIVTQHNSYQFRRFSRISVKSDCFAKKKGGITLLSGMLINLFFQKNLYLCLLDQFRILPIISMIPLV